MSLLTASFSSEVAMVMVVDMDTDFSLAEVLVTALDPPNSTPTLPSSVLTTEGT
jgi:CO dehydrogenase nickel-insertion accessory protein CooC1